MGGEGKGASVRATTLGGPPLLGVSFKTEVESLVRERNDQIVGTRVLDWKG